MKHTFLLAITLLMSYSLSAQGDLEFKKSFGGSKIIQDGRTLKTREVMKLMEPYPEAYQEFKKAKSNYDGAMALGVVGGALIGWPIGTALGGGDPQWGLAAGGAALLLFTIPLNKGFSKHSQAAIDLYNKRADGSARIKPSLRLFPYATGAKLILRF